MSYGLIINKCKFDIKLQFREKELLEEYKNLIELAKMCPHDDPLWHNHLNNLVVAICQFPIQSRERRRGMNEIVRIMQKSGKIWRENVNYYEDVLQNAFSSFFPLNFCNYDPSRGNFITYFNMILKRRIIDLYRQKQPETHQIQSSFQNQDGVTIDPIDQLPALPDSIPILECWERLKKWVDEDEEGTLSGCHIRGNPQANCQKLIQCLLFEGRKYKDIAQELHSTIPTIQARYRDHCQPLLRRWLEADQCLDMY